MNSDWHSQWIWLDGQWLPWDDARVHVLTHTLHYGMGVFEGVRAYQAERSTAIFCLQQHTRRLLESAHILNIKVPFTAEHLHAIQIEALKKNQLESAYIRPMVFYGMQDMGLHARQFHVQAMVAAWRWGNYLGSENLAKGIHVKISSLRRYSPAAAMSKAKANGHYINSMLALHEAVSDGYDEALMLDQEGFVCEGTGENIFLVKDGCLYTPDLSSALGGITRWVIMTLAKDDGLEVHEGRITRDQAYTADECFFTGTAAEVVPVCSIDKRAIGQSRRGPITRRLQQLYFDVVHGRLPKYQQWLTVI